MVSVASLLEYLVSLVVYFQFVVGDNLNATITFLLLLYN